MPKDRFVDAARARGFADPRILSLAAAWAQQPPTVRIRGTIEAVDGPMLTIKSREGTDMKVRMTDNVAVFGVAKTALSEIKAGSYIGVSAMPRARRHPEGARRSYLPRKPARRRRRFPALGSAPNSTMTNATVAETVKGTDGQNITGQVQGRREESRGAAGYADRHLRRPATSPN